MNISEFGGLERGRKISGEVREKRTKPAFIPSFFSTLVFKDDLIGRGVKC